MPCLLPAVRPRVACGEEGTPRQQQKSGFRLSSWIWIYWAMGIVKYRRELWLDQSVQLLGRCAQNGLSQKQGMAIATATLNVQKKAYFSWSDYLRRCMSDMYYWQSVHICVNPHVRRVLIAHVSPTVQCTRCHHVMDGSNDFVFPFSSRRSDSNHIRLFVTIFRKVSSSIWYRWVNVKKLT